MLTPHLGEMARLTGMLPSTLEASRVDVAKEWAKVELRARAEGRATVIADPAGRVSVNPTGNPGMATAGMGDVLTGRDRRRCSRRSSRHGTRRVSRCSRTALAGDLAAREVGAIGLVAGDVVGACRARWRW